MRSEIVTTGLPLNTVTITAEGVLTYTCEWKFMLSLTYFNEQRHLHVSVSRKEHQKMLFTKGVE